MSNKKKEEKKSRFVHPNEADKLRDMMLSDMKGLSISTSDTEWDSDKVSSNVQEKSSDSDSPFEDAPSVSSSRKTNSSKLANSVIQLLNNKKKQNEMEHELDEHSAL